MHSRTYEVVPAAVDVAVAATSCCCYYHAFSCHTVGLLLCLDLVKKQEKKKKLEVFMCAVFFLFVNVRKET